MIQQSRRLQMIVLHPRTLDNPKMDRVLEPELMDDPKQAQAYAQADFSEENQYFILTESGLGHFVVTQPDDRHWIANGRLPS